MKFVYLVMCKLNGEKSIYGAYSSARKCDEAFARAVENASRTTGLTLEYWTEVKQIL